MNDVLSVIKQGAEFLQAKGFEVEIEGFEPVSPSEIEAFDSEDKVRLPEGLRQILTKLDGFAVSWKSGEEEGIYLFPSLEELSDFRRWWVENEIPIWKAELDESKTENREILDQIQHWVPFEDHYNGDFHCVDCRDGQVYYASHEQVGKLHRIADDVISYLANRAKTGFME